MGWNHQPVKYQLYLFRGEQQFKVFQWSSNVCFVYPTWTCIFVCVCVVFWAKVSKIPSKGLLHFSSFTINFFLRLGFPRMSWPVTYSMMIAWNHMKPMIACHVYHLSRTSMKFTISNISQKNIPKISPPKKRKETCFTQSYLSNNFPLVFFLKEASASPAAEKRHRMITWMPLLVLKCLERCFPVGRVKKSGTKQPPGIKR